MAGFGLTQLGCERASVQPAFLEPDSAVTDSCPIPSSIAALVGGTGGGGQPHKAALQRLAFFVFLVCRSCFVFHFCLKENTSGLRPGFRATLPCGIPEIAFEIVCSSVGHPLDGTSASTCSIRRGSARSRPNMARSRPHLGEVDQIWTLRPVLVRAGPNAGASSPPKA